jgi:hypothetical protein
LPLISFITFHGYPSLLRFLPPLSRGTWGRGRRQVARVRTPAERLHPFVRLLPAAAAAVRIRVSHSAADAAESSLVGFQCRLPRSAPDTRERRDSSTRFRRLGIRARARAAAAGMPEIAPCSAARAAGRPSDGDCRVAGVGRFDWGGARPPPPDFRAVRVRGERRHGDARAEFVLSTH